MASNVSPEGYVYGTTPVNTNPFWDNSQDIEDITASASVDANAGTPSVELNVTKNDVGVANLEFKFHNLKGQTGTTGNVEADATVDNNTGTPSVTVNKTYPTEDTTKFTFNFHNLKGANGQDGAPGTPGANGADGTDGVTPVITGTATVDNTSSDTPTCDVTKSGTDAAPTFNFAFHGIKGASGGGGGGSFDLSNIPDLDNYVFSNLSTTKGTADTFDPTTTQIVDTASAILGTSAEFYNLHCDEITLNGKFDVSTDDEETFTEQELNNFKLYGARCYDYATIPLDTHTTQIISENNVAIYHPISSTNGYCSFKRDFLRVDVKNENANSIEIILKGRDEHENRYYIKCKLKLNYNSYILSSRTTAFGGFVQEFIIGKSNQTSNIVLDTPEIYLLDKNNSVTIFPGEGWCIIYVPITFSLSKRQVTVNTKPAVGAITARTNITEDEVYTHFATKYGVTFPS